MRGTRTHHTQRPRYSPRPFACLESNQSTKLNLFPKDQEYTVMHNGELNREADRVRRDHTRKYRDARHSLYKVLSGLHPECHEQRASVSWHIHWYRDALARINDPCKRDVHYIVEYADNREWQAKLLLAA